MAEGSVATEQEISGQTPKEDPWAKLAETAPKPKESKPIKAVKEAVKRTAQAAVVAIRLMVGPGDEALGAVAPVADTIIKGVGHSQQKEDPSRGQKPSEALAPVLPPNKQAELAEKSKPKDDPTVTV